jgi:hypothetical protein
MWQEKTAQDREPLHLVGNANYRPTSWLSTRAAVGN